MRPRPKKTTTKWGLKPTPEQLEYRAARAQAARGDSQTPNRGVGASLSGLGITLDHDRGHGHGGPGSGSSRHGGGYGGGSSSGSGSGSSSSEYGFQQQSRAPMSNFERQTLRVYCGGITPQMSESDLRRFFNSVIVTVPGRPPAPEKEPVREVQMRETFAFVEMYNRTDTEIALSMDGISFMGATLKLKPPKELRDNVNAPPFKRWTIPGVVSNVVENGPNKIFLGNIPTALTEDNIKLIISAFGQLAAFNLVKDAATGGSKGYAFFTYLNPEVTAKAVAALNGMPVMNRQLACSLASANRTGGGGAGAGAGAGGAPPPPRTVPPPGAPFMQGGLGFPGAGMNMNMGMSMGVGAGGLGVPSQGMMMMTMPSSMGGMGTLGMPVGGAPPLPPLSSAMAMSLPLGQLTAASQAYPASTSTSTSTSTLASLAGLGAVDMSRPAGTPSRFLALRNAVTLEEMNSSERDDILLDVTEGLKAFGQIEDYTWEASSTEAVIYIAYTDLEGGVGGAVKTHGRKFGDNVVKVAFVSEEEWKRVKAASASSSSTSSTSASS